MEFSQLPPPVLEIIRKMRPYPDGIQLYPPRVEMPGTPKKRWIKTIHKLNTGAYQINGTIGIKRFYGFSRREAERLYNMAARTA